jgi:hypothetical protein
MDSSERQPQDKDETGNNVAAGDAEAPPLRDNDARKPLRVSSPSSDKEEQLCLDDTAPFLRRTANEEKDEVEFRLDDNTHGGINGSDGGLRYRHRGAGSAIHISDDSDTRTYNTEHQPPGNHRKPAKSL